MLVIGNQSLVTSNIYKLLLLLRCVRPLVEEVFDNKAVSANLCKTLRDYFIVPPHKDDLCIFCTSLYYHI